MRVVDEETLGEADLEAKAPADAEVPKPADEEGEKPPAVLETVLETPLPEIEEEFIPVKPKRKARPKKEKPEVPPLEKPPKVFAEPSKIRKEKLKEQIECPNGRIRIINIAKP